jgi:hypothetical protein
MSEVQNETVVTETVAVKIPFQDAYLSAAKRGITAKQFADEQKVSIQTLRNKISALRLLAKDASVELPKLADGRTSGRVSTKSERAAALRAAIAQFSAE